MGWSGGGSCRDDAVSGVVRAESYERAEKFYGEVLSLKQGQELPGLGGGGMFEAPGGTTLIVYENPGLKAPKNPTLGFGGASQTASMNGMAEIVGMRSAWSKDSQGNILNLVVMM